jgi:error-prone DNA polymerase
MGVPLFQEQAMKIAIVAAGFTPGELTSCARRWRPSAGSAQSARFQTKMIEGMAKNGYEREFAERCFRQIEGFGEYGFPESHAASFALLVYVSSWIKCHYPDVFCAALLNSQPMGFYAPDSWSAMRASMVWMCARLISTCQTGMRNWNLAGRRPSIFTPATGR